MSNNLTEKEHSFLRRIYKNAENLHYNYIASGFMGSIALLGLIFGIKFQAKDGFLMAIYFGTLSLVILMKSLSDKTVVIILKKLQSQLKDRGE